MERLKRHQDGSIGMEELGVILTVAIWAAVIFTAFHFVAKYW